MKCGVCGETILNELDEVLLNADGDFACSKACAKKYRDDRDHFFNVAVHDDQAFADWMGVDIKDLTP